jgi:hypothetical protein
MSTILFTLSPIVGILVAVFALRWALRSHREERAPWLAVLDVSAGEVADTDQLGTLDGIAIATTESVVAPFSGRQCLAFTCEIITQETFGQRTTWNRVYTTAAGTIGVTGPGGGLRGEAHLDGALPLFPPELASYNAFSGSAEAIFRGAPDALPPHLLAIVQGLSHETRQLVFRPSGQLIGGKRLFFNERIVVSGQPIVIVGASTQAEQGLVLLATNETDVFVGFGTKGSERARIAKLPVGGELFGAVMGGIIAGGLVAMVASMLLSK